MLTYHILYSDGQEKKVQNPEEISKAIGCRPYNPDSIFVGVAITGTPRGVQFPDRIDSLGRVKTLVQLLERKLGKPIMVDK